MPRLPDRPRMNPRLFARINRKKAQLDRSRPLPRDTVRRLNEDLRVFLTYHSNAIEGNSLSLQETEMVIDYGITIRTPRRNMLDVCGQCNVSKKSGVIPNTEKEPLTFLGMGADCGQGRARSKKFFRIHYAMMIFISLLLIVSLIS